MSSTVASSNYVNNSIFTDYALQLINDDLIDEHTTYNFKRVSISNVETELDSTLTETQPGIYTLDVESVSYSDNICTVEVNIPEEVTDFTIRTVALYHFDGTKDRLFAYANINAVKPAQLSFALVMDLNFELQFINLYPTKVDLEVKDYDYVTTEEKEEIQIKYTDTIINLERVEDRTTRTIGYNKPEVFYNQEREVAHSYDALIGIHKYGKMSNIFNGYIADYYVNDTNASYSFYKLRNLENINSYMDVTLGNMITYNSNFHFTSTKGSTVFVNLLIDDFENGFIIKKGTLNNGTNEFSLFIENGALKFRVFGMNNSYFEIQYVFTEDDIKLLGNVYNSIIITFNNDYIFPSITLHINNVLYNTSIIYNGTPDTAITANNIPVTTYFIEDGEFYNSNFKIKSFITLNKAVTQQEIEQITRIAY